MRGNERALPIFPRRIAVVTSPSGAAIRDILNVFLRRAPWIHVTVIPAVVQGDGAAEQIIQGLEFANRHGLGEIVLLARGGGSIEDLWCFNDERLARAICASRLPVISAVGHEIDFTISDFVADKRAATPSVGAEIVTAAWVDIPAWLTQTRERLTSAMKKDLQVRRNLLSHVTARLVNPRDKLREQAQRCDEWMMRLEQAMIHFLGRKKAGLIRRQRGWMRFRH